MSDEKQRNARLMNPATLAFLGDAVWELFVRSSLTKTGARQAGELHTAAVQFVCALAQSAVFEVVQGELKDDEADMLRRGRNAHCARCPKNVSPADYSKATAIEVLFGYLFLAEKKERLDELMNFCFNNLSEIRS